MLKYRGFWLTTGGLLTLLIVYLSLMPHPPQPVTFDNADKVEHGLAYALLSFWFCEVYITRLSRAVVIAGLVGLGVGLEYVQGWTGYRTFDVMDMLADGAGVLAGWWLVRTLSGGLFVYIENCFRACCKIDR